MNQEQKQKVFDIVKDHLLTQNAKSTAPPINYSNDGYCLYRSNNNLKCAIGCLIPDELYNPELEYHDVKSILALSPKLQNYFSDTFGYATDEDDDFLDLLQHIHDIDSVEFWARSLKDFAQRNGFNF